MASAPKQKESPTEPFKRALGLAVRAIAGDGEVQVSYAPGKPELDGKAVQLPEPSRVPSQREIAVIRGWADSLALTAACHDAKVHARLAPSAGPARAVFETWLQKLTERHGAAKETSDNSIYISHVWRLKNGFVIELRSLKDTESPVVDIHWVKE